MGPRYYGAACDHTGFARIDVSWTGPATLRVAMDHPALEWTVTARSTRLLGFLNTVSGALPIGTWRPRSLLHARERIARTLGMGNLQLAGVMPSGHTGTLMPQHMYFVDESHAVFVEADLGSPVRLEENPTIGGVPLPSRGVLAIGQAVWQILDRVEYNRTRGETADIGDLT